MIPSDEKVNRAQHHSAGLKLSGLLLNVKVSRDAAILGDDKKLKEYLRTHRRFEAVMSKFIQQPYVSFAERVKTVIPALHAAAVEDVARNAKLLRRVAATEKTLVGRWTKIPKLEKGLIESGKKEVECSNLMNAREEFYRLLQNGLLSGRHPARTTSILVAPPLTQGLRTA